MFGEHYCTNFASSPSTALAPKSRVIMENGPPKRPGILKKSAKIAFRLLILPIGSPMRCGWFTTHHLRAHFLPGVSARVNRATSLPPHCRRVAGLLPRRPCIAKPASSRPLQFDLQSLLLPPVWEGSPPATPEVVQPTNHVGCEPACYLGQFVEIDIEDGF
jgi:hypothetical protein